MISVKNSLQIAAMRDAGRITGEALLAARDALREGMTTYELDKVIHDYIVRSGARPSFLGYYDFPASACISINDEVIHGIPSKKRVIRAGDVVKIDVGAYYKGFHGDSARTYGVGNISDEAQRLIDETEASFFEALKVMVAGNRIGDIGAAVQRRAEAAGYSVVREFVGHGIGASLHESPEVPNYGRASHGVRLCAGMTLAVEPMINEGGAAITTDRDGWTVRTADHKLSAHYENTVAITDNGPVLLTTV
jgi:methionyl aminopeptidase